MEDFRQLIGEVTPHPDYIPSAGRQIFIPKAAAGIAFIDFKDLCEKNLAARDYIEVGLRYRGLIINNIPLLNDEKRNESRRFIWLIDALYEAKCFIICNAEEKIDKIYEGSDWKFEFDRTKSRLIELTNSSRNN
jgi:cell division protein ZapE